MNSHLKEYEIDLLITSPESITEEDKLRFTAHIEKCELCKEHLQTAKEFYAELGERFEKEPKDKDSILASRIYKSKTALKISFLSTERNLEYSKKPQGEIVEFTEIKPSLALRVINLAVQYPFKAAGGFGLIAAAFFLVLNITSTPSKSYPEYAKIKDGQLTVYDINGNSLWQKSALGLPDGSTLTGFQNSEGTLIEQTFILIEDVHSNPGPEVLIFGLNVFDYSKPDFALDTLYCFDVHGKLLWSKTYNVKEFKQYKEKKGGFWKIRDMITIKKNDKKSDRLFISINNLPFAPSALLEIDGLTGKEIHTYAHFGTIRELSAQNIPETNLTRIVICGVNNGYNKSFLAVLDPDFVSGTGPGSKGYDNDKTKQNAKEIYYILFPRTHLAHGFSGTLYNMPRKILINSEGTIIISIGEFPDEPDIKKGNLFYTLDKDINVKSVTFSDDLKDRYNQLSSQGALLDKQGNILEPLDSSYAETLKKAVLYWDGEEFVSTHTPNKKYLEATNLP